jgi:lipid-A-disaccharide synthase
VVALVAVDSPAANFPICKVMKKRGAKVIHLVAPQLWAWGRWRVRKLRRLTDLVLCLLPFEEQWFKNRGIEAHFIGHPRINRPLDKDKLIEGMHGLPSGNPRIAVLPGSRAHEVRANIRLLADVFTELQGRHHSLSGVIVAANPDLAALVRRRLKMFPTGLHLVTTDVDPVIAWADLCLAVSGTVTLDITRQRKPMVGIYKTSILSWLVSKVLLRTPLRLLPNIIADREIVPEFVPYCGGVMPILKATSPILLDSKKAAVQAEHLGRVLTRFSQKKPAIEAAKLILEAIGETERVRPQVAVEG